MTNETARERINSYVRFSTRKMLEKMGKALHHTSEGQTIDTAVSVSFVLFGEILQGHKIYAEKENGDGKAHMEPFHIFPELLALRYYHEMEHGNIRIPEIDPKDEHKAEHESGHDVAVEEDEERHLTGKAAHVKDARMESEEIHSHKHGEAVVSHGGSG